MIKDIQYNTSWKEHISVAVDTWAPLIVYKEEMFGNTFMQQTS